MNASRLVFPNAETKGCYFHLTQAIWKQAVLRGLKSQYGNNETIRKTIQKLLALPFVPVPDINDVFESILNEVDEIGEGGISDGDFEAIKGLVEYMEVTYVRGRPARGRRPATNARFPPTIWSVYQLCLDRQHRTTNAVEGWHSRFQRIIVSHHAGIWKFLDNIL